MASGLVTASQKVPKPWSKVRQMTKISGATRIAARYVRAIARRP